jgi:DNA-binding PadR family transcriptional regulator
MAHAHRPRPIREPTYFVLAALLDGPLHGYGIIQHAYQLSGQRIRLAAGTLYEALDRLASSGDIAIDRQETVDGRVRRYYRLTDQGRHALHQEATRMEQAAQIVTRRPATPANRPSPA